MQIEVLYYEAARDFNPEVPTYGIRIFGSDYDSEASSWEQLRDKHNKYVSVEDFIFDDIQKQNSTQILFGLWTARTIIMGFYPHRNTCEQLMVHCLAGQSRSPAVAIALNDIFLLGYNSDEMKRRYYQYNKHVYKTMIEGAQALVREDPSTLPAKESDLSQLSLRS